MTDAQEPNSRAGGQRPSKSSEDGERPWLQPTRDALRSAPDPARAGELADDLLGTPLPGGGSTLADAIGDRMVGGVPALAEQLARILFALCGIAPFFASQLRRQPDWILELLADDLRETRRPRDLESRLDALLAAAPARDAASVLRRFKYYELARITIRDASDEWVPLAKSAVTLRDVSALADVILQRALSIVTSEVEAQIGPARWPTPEGRQRPLGFAVLGLGKLGSEELNYSSDVDLVYVYETPDGPLALPEGSDAGTHFSRLSPVEHFTRIAQAFGQLVGGVSADGFLYRVDLELRPEGAQGTLVTGDEALATYYEAWADTWERAAFMKARAVAGDLALGWRAIRQVDAMIYHSTMDYLAVESIRSLKQRVEDRHGSNASGFNVKIDAGGIRDVEFIAQALQLLHGGRIPQLRVRSTQGALQGIAEVGLLPTDQVERLLQAYRFLRRTENRIQMEGEQQRHVVPAAEPALTRLARAMGFVGDDARERFEAALEAERAVVLGLFGSSFGEGGKQRIMELFERNVPQLTRGSSTRAMVEELADHFARCIDDSPEPERALNNLDRFIQSVGSHRFYYELLLDRAELVPRLTALFGASKFLSNTLASQPGLIEPVFADPNVLLLSRDELLADLSTAKRHAGDSDELLLDAVRIFQHRQMLNVGLLDIDEKVSRAQVECALTDIAEVCLDEALDQAKQRLAASRDGVPPAAERGRYLIVGMGKLGSFELGYGSDLDLIFLYDLLEEDADATPLAQHYFVRLTQRLISVLQTPTAEGTCYEIDARLRPSGNQGTLVTSRAAFIRYHDESAEVWERQILLRARPIAGDAQLAERFREIRQDILCKPLPDDLAAAIDSIRQRMEVELANETTSKRNFKTGRGGLLDVETVAQYLMLRHGREHAELHEVDRLEHHLARLEALGLLAKDHAATLQSGWDFLQSLAGRLRIVENRSISDLDSERGDLDSLARRLGYDATRREGGARRGLLRDYQRHTEAIRTVYEAVVRRGSP